MVYSFLKILMRITVRVFFRSITIRNKNLIPEKGPVMVLANHPSTFMDPIVIASLLDRKVFFLAKGELFKGKIAKWLFPKFNMIPVYRKQDDPSQMSKNNETFIKCFEHLEKGGAILMFPEGISITERKLRPIKTGAARIVLGAEARNGFKLGIEIINVGLNYQNPHKFNRDLFINIGKPIHVADYQRDHQEDSFKSASNLSEAIRIQLEKHIIDIEDTSTDDLVKNIETLYKQKVFQEMGINEKDKSQEFLITKNILDAVNYYSTVDPTRLENLRSRIQMYFENLEKTGIIDENISGNDTAKSFMGSNLKSLFIIVMGFPFYIFGLINNFLPFEIPGLLAKKISKTIEFRGAIGMVGGMFTFIIFYTIQLYLMWYFTHSHLLTMCYALSLPTSGLFAYWYYHTVGKIRAKWLLMVLFFKKSVLISSLITERERIISEFDKARILYEKWKSKN